MDRRSFLAGTAGFPLFLGFSRNSQDRDFDVLVRGGTVVDGSGAPPFRSDVGIRGETVASVSDLTGATARKVLEATDLTVSPGFIDVHTHSEEELLVNPKAESKIRQGVTTEILGMDGDSYQPAIFGEELRKLETKGIALNAGSFVGQGGRLAEGFFADVAIFDTARVRDRATFERPHQYADGFEAVLVNGALVLEGGGRTEALPGKVIRGSLHRA